MRYPRNVEGFIAKRAGGKGFGLFATHRYAKGGLLCRARGVRIPHSDRRLTHRAVQVSQSVFIEPTRFSAIWYLNHSCAPNAYVDGDALYARKAIRAGDEITADYSLFTDYPSWDMHCACGHRRCRRLIVSYRMLKSASKRSERFVSAYLR